LTLKKFKIVLKTTCFVIVVVFYGLGAFFLGKHSQESVSALVKGVRTQLNVERQIDRPQPYSDTQSGAVIGSYVNLCSNTAYSFQLSYPKDWFTTYNDKYQECTFFAPFSFVVPSYVEHDIVPIHVVPIEPSQWQSTVKLYENPNDYQNVLTAKNTEINGKSVEIIDSIATGNGFVPMGFVKKSYLVFDGKVPLIIYYQQQNTGEDINSMEKILNDIVISLKYF
jgi:hypothetical protein